MIKKSWNKQGLAGIFLDYQREWLSDPAKVKISDKSRQIGLSWAEAYDSAELASRSKAEGGMDSWIIHLNEDAAREWVLDVAFWAKFLNLAASEVEETVIDNENNDIKAFRIEFASGCRVTALSSRPSNLRGKRGKVVIEEAAFHESLDELIKACMAFKIWGGKISIISTHNGEDCEYYQLLQQVRAGRKEGWSLHRCTFDQAIEQGLYERVANRTGLPLTPESKQKWIDEIYADYGEHADEELRCIPRRGGTIFIPRMLAERRMEGNGREVIWFEYEDNYILMSPKERKSYSEELCKKNLNFALNSIAAYNKTYYGQDFARKTNLSCIAILDEDNSLRFRVPVLLKIVNCPFEDQKWISDWIIKALKQRTRFVNGAIDATGSGAGHAEWVHSRHPSVEQTVMTQAWHADAWPRYKTGLEDGNLILPKDGDLLDSHALVVKEQGIPHIPRKKTIKDSRGNEAHGDDLQAICIANYAASTLPDSTAYEAVFC